MKLTTLIVVLPLLALSIAALPGCNVFSAQTPQEQLTVFAYDVSVIRSVVAAQPPGARRDALLKQLDTVSNYTGLAEIVVALTQAGTPPATIPSDTAARIEATK